MKGSRHLCTFWLDGLWFGIEVGVVQEVIRYQPMTPVPLSPAGIAGLINLRGQIVTAIDLRQRLGLPPGSHEEQPANLVVRSREGPVSLLVQEVGEVIQVEEQAIDPVPDTVELRAQTLLKGVCQLPDRLLLLLDGEKAVSIRGAPEAG